MPDGGDGGSPRAAARRQPVARHHAGKYLEFSIEGEDYYPWQYDLFLGEPYRIEDGKATVTDTPGWGVEINPAWLETAQYKASELGG